jgi:hypothetical protein
MDSAPVKRVTISADVQRLLLLCIVVLLIFWGSRLAGLSALPLHNDEGLHLTRAVEVWNGHPFWSIDDGKIINHWLIAALLPQADPVTAGRIPTILIGALGITAGCALAYRWFGLTAAFLTAVLWLTNPLLFFYERLAFSDAQAGALIVVAVFFAALVKTNRNTVLTGAALASAALMKFTAIPFSAAVGLVLILDDRVPSRTRLIRIGIIALIVLLAFAIPVLYLMRRGGGLFEVALGWIGSKNAGFQPIENFIGNSARLIDIAFGFGSPVWVLILIGGLAALIWMRSKQGWLLAFGVGLPLLSMMILGREMLSRHYAAALPLAMVAGGCGWGYLLDRLYMRRGLRGGVTLITWLSAAAFIPFAQTAYSAPSALPLPNIMRTQYITEHSGGYGLREAMQQLPTLAQPGIPILGSMFPDGCRRANFYAQDGWALICSDAPGLERARALLAEYGRLYVLSDTPGIIGGNPSEWALGETGIVSSFPRPGEAPANASVVLYAINVALP